MKTLAALALLLVACGGPTAHPVKGPDGKLAGYRIKCKGSMSACRAKARETCPNGYELVDEPRDPGASSSTSWTSEGVAYGDNHRDSLLIRCSK